MNSKRRILIIFFSVLTGSLISLWIMKKRLGTLKPADYMQLGFNFLFAAAVVVGIAILLQKMNDKEKNRQDNK